MNEGNNELILQPAPEFTEWPKIPRFNREVLLTEKIDGTNASILIKPIAKDFYCDKLIDYFYGMDGSTWGMFAGSRTRWLSETDDNYGFAKWVKANLEELKKLGEGHHFGEWWGNGIQRNYGVKQKHFSLFNVTRWADPTVRPACCQVVPTLATCTGANLSEACSTALERLRTLGSSAAPGFMKPEGICIFHTTGKHYYKMTLEKDEQPKSFVKSDS